MATLTKGKTFTNGELVTPANLHALVDSATVANIVNADIASNAAIADTKLAQIATAGKVANTATSATAASTANAIVARDASGNFSAGTITANLTGTASGNAPATGIAPTAITGTAVITTDSRLSDARTPTSHNHDASAINAGTLAIARIPTGATATTVCIGNDSRLSDARTPTSHNHDDRYYTESEIDTKLSGLPVSGHTHAATDITSGTLANARTTATNANTASAIVARDASGNFSAGTITANLTGTASGNAPATGIAPSAITGTAVITTDSRLSDARTPTAHNHDASAINAGTLAIARIPTGATATTVCIGNDSRLSDARTPTSHTHTIADVTNLQTELNSKVSGSNLGLCKAWVNFNHSRMLGVTNAANGESISVTAGSSSGTWNSTTAFSIGQIGIIYYITSAGSVPNASLGGINVSTLGFQIRAISGNTATIKLIAGPATTSQTITGNGGTSGFQYISYGIRAQYGVASITKAASGSHMNFTFNFSTPFEFIDYCYNFQMDARSSGDFFIQTKNQSSIQIQVANFSDASVSSQMNFMAFGL